MASKVKGRIVLWCDAGANQRALAHKIPERFDLAGIVVERPRRRRKILSLRTATRMLEKVLYHEVDSLWPRLLSRYAERFPRLPDVESREVENINCDATEELTRSAGADLVMVSGTRLVREKLLALPLEIGILNLHTGLSPYVKGGPNCTNWCLAEGNYHLIGNTVMWIDAGIDSGDLLTTRWVDFDGDEDLDGIHWKVMEEAHELYLEAVDAVLRSPDRCPKVPQREIAEGTTYYTRDWGLRERRSLLRNLRNGRFREAVTSGEVRARRAELRTVPLTYRASPK